MFWYLWVTMIAAIYITVNAHRIRQTGATVRRTCVQSVRISAVVNLQIANNPNASNFLNSK